MTAVTELEQRLIEQMVYYTGLYPKALQVRDLQVEVILDPQYLRPWETEQAIQEILESALAPYQVNVHWEVRV